MKQTKEQSIDVTTEIKFKANQIYSTNNNIKIFTIKDQSSAKSNRPQQCLLTSPSSSISITTAIERKKKTEKKDLIC